MNTCGILADLCPFTRLIRKWRRGAYLSNGLAGLSDIE
nr:MAG TPA: hypothetical protein [Caudoviricetes sp.]